LNGCRRTVHNHADLNGLKKLKGTAMRLLIFAIMAIATITAQAQPPDLAFKPADKGAYTFNTGVLKGTLRADGRSIGLLSFEHVPTGTRIEGNDYGIFSHYRVFTANKRYGHGAWEWPSTAKVLTDGALEVRWPAAEDRPFEMGAVYRWVTPDTLDLTTSVTAKADLKDFESFLASYFAEAFPASTVYAKGAPGKEPFFQTTGADAGVWQAFPRDAAAVPIIQDGRWKIEPNPVDWVIRDEFAAPLGIRRNKDNGLCAVLMSRPEDCYCVMTPNAGEGHRSLYLCLFGRDVKAGETASAQARLVVRVLPKDEDAVALQSAYLKEKAGSGRSVPR
jgi:hypothetical protein